MTIAGPVGRFKTEQELVKPNKNWSNPPAKKNKGWREHQYKQATQYRCSTCFECVHPLIGASNTSNPLPLPHHDIPSPFRAYSPPGAARSEQAQVPVYQQSERRRWYTLPSPTCWHLRSHSARPLQQEPGGEYSSCGEASIEGIHRLWFWLAWLRNRMR